MTDEPQQPPDPSMPDPEDLGCGVSWLWETPRGDKFYYACRNHDIAYERQARGDTSYPNSRLVDSVLLSEMLDAAHGSLLLKLKAYLFCGLARTYGIWGWKKPEVK
jgi:hypothetical protein